MLFKNNIEFIPPVFKASKKPYYPSHPKNKGYFKINLCPFEQKKQRHNAKHTIQNKKNHTKATFPIRQLVFNLGVRLSRFHGILLLNIFNRTQDGKY